MCTVAQWMDEQVSRNSSRRQEVTNLPDVGRRGWDDKLLQTPQFSTTTRIFAAINLVLEANLNHPEMVDCDNQIEALLGLLED